jgi:hypothetical protein
MRHIVGAATIGGALIADLMGCANWPGRPAPLLPLPYWNGWGLFRSPDCLRPESWGPIDVPSLLLAGLALIDAAPKKGPRERGLSIKGDDATQQRSASKPATANLRHSTGNR